VCWAAACPRASASHTTPHPQNHTRKPPQKPEKTPKKRVKKAKKTLREAVTQAASACCAPARPNPPAWKALICLRRWGAGLERGSGGAGNSAAADAMGAARGRGSLGEARIRPGVPREGARAAGGKAVWGQEFDRGAGKNFNILR